MELGVELERAKSLDKSCQHDGVGEIGTTELSERTMMGIGLVCTASRRERCRR